LSKKIVIAIDGYSSCGKSTIARALAKELGYAYIDTGAMYRAVTLYLIENNLLNLEELKLKGELINDLHIDNIENILEHISIRFKVNHITGISETYLNDKNVERDIRKMKVSENVSHVSTVKEVRKKMVRLQQKIGEEKNVVMDGRDIGTTVFPDADVKIFMTADHDVRVKRRYDELITHGIEVTVEEVSENIKSRDYEDTHREESPLTKAPDAVVLDNTHLSRREQLDFVLKLVHEKLQV
jgi:CMP/dCMP kinase